MASNSNNTVEPGRHPQDEDKELTLLATANVLLSHRKLVIVLPIVTGILFGLMAYFSPRSFSVVSLLAPETSEDRAGKLSGIAAQFGISVPGTGGTESTEFYQALLKSRELLLSVANTNYKFKTGEGEQKSGTIPQLYEIEGETQNETLVATLRDMQANVLATSDAESNTITVQTIARWPELARQMNERLLALADQFNVTRRASRAGEERKFVEGRMAEARSDLNAAEARLEAFLSRNRTFQGSPQLIIERQRLQRNLDLAQGVYTTLAQSYEQARIDEVRNTPVLTVISRPQVVEPMGRGLVMKTLIGGVLGFLLAVVLAFARTNLAEQRLSPSEEYARFVQLKREALDGVLRTVRIKAARS